MYIGSDSHLPALASAGQFGLAKLQSIRTFFTTAFQFIFLDRYIVYLYIIEFFMNLPGGTGLPPGHLYSLLIRATLI